jgi:hypothetical protein
MAILSRLARIVWQFCILIYVATAVLYTSNHFVVFPLRSRISFWWTGSSLQDSPTSWSSFLSDSFASSTVVDQYFNKADANSHLSLDIFSSPNDVVLWAPSGFTAMHTGIHHMNLAPTTMSEDLFLSKAFAQSMHPSKIVPFFYRASGEFDKEDITLTTLVTSDRFKVFAQLVENYQGEFFSIERLRTSHINADIFSGPISVTIHVKSTPADIDAIFTSLHTLYASTPSMSTYVDVHLVIDLFDRQFNTWRNVARLFARTDFVMMLDVDFVVCTDFRRSVRESEAVMNKLREGVSAFVIPAFEYIKFKDGIDQATFPRDKKVRWLFRRTRFLWHSHPDLSHSRCFHWFILVVLGCSTVPGDQDTTAQITTDFMQLLPAKCTESHNINPRTSLMLYSRKTALHGKRYFFLPLTMSFQVLSSN